MLGRYELLFVLGQGGMGEVHLARLSGTGGFEKLCIVKTILPAMKAETQFVERFHHEARVLTHLTHSNIAQVYDMGEADGTLFMAIEYVPGVDLARIETRSATTGTFLPVPIALHIGRLMTEALGYAHRKTGPEGAALGIVHRDVSPQNVMVSYEGEVKVIDFGLAKSAARSKHTLPSTVMGKLGYMSPEQALARPVDARSDIFSAGIVIWEMLAGRPLYQGATMAEMVAMMANPTIPPLTTLREEVSETLDQVVMRALHKDPAARYGRADEFARALNEIAVREGLGISSEDAGNFVRAMCPEEFAAERSLQSQLSLLRKGGQRPPSSPGHLLKPKSGTVSAAEGVEGTFVRTESQGAPLTPAQRALSVQQQATAPHPPVRQPETVRMRPVADEPLVAPARSKAPLVILGLIAVIGLGVGGFVLLGGDKPRDPPKEPIAAVDPIKPLEPVEPLKPIEEPVKAVDPPRAVEAPDAGMPAVVERAKVVPKGTLFKILKRNDGSFIDLGKGAKLREGDKLRLVGEPVDGKKREVYGQARVLELKARGTVADLLMEVEGDSATQLYGFVDETVVERPKVAKVTPVGGGSAAPDTKTEPKPEVKPSMEVNPFPKPEDPKPEPVEVKKEPAAPAAASIQGSVQLVSRPGNLLTGGGTETTVNVIVMAGSATDCDVHLPNGTHQRFGQLKSGANQQSPLTQWARDPRPDPNRSVAGSGAENFALVECKEGSAYFKYSVAVRKR
jgi:serine/threonine-protein kinase